MEAFCSAKILEYDGQCSNFYKNKCEFNFTEECNNEAKAKFIMVYKTRICSPDYPSTTSIGNRIGEHKKIDQQFEGLEPIGNIIVTIILFLLIALLDFFLKRLSFLYDRK